MRVRCLPPETDADGRPQLRVLATLDSEPLATVHFWTEAGDTQPMHASGRTALLTFLPLAMRLGAALEVEDGLEALSQAQAEEWQQVMACWHPGVLHAIPLRARRLSSVASPEARETARALMPFSGGVDSSHTLWHHSAARGVSPVQVQSGLLIHGLDIPLEDATAFAAARLRAGHMLQAHGARLLSVATDIRAIERRHDLNWETHTHGIALAACLSLFEFGHGAVLIASTYPVYDLSLPWGSNPVTDVMLGGPVPYLHSGSPCNKLAKVTDIAQDTVLTTHLRVCWQGERKGANCGFCFKCLTTQACLWLSGAPAPSAFDRPATANDLAGIPIRNGVNHRLVTDLQIRAREAGRDDLAAALGRSLRKSRWHRRHRLKQWLAALGLTRSA
jgi:hypothetical protein